MKRKIAAIMAADVAGYARLVAEDEEETLRRLTAHRGVFEESVTRFSGRIFNTAGDAILAEFPSAVDAVRCAIEVQESVRTRNLAYPASRPMSFRIGITIGDVVEEDGDLLGDGVNIAARLQGYAEPGGLCISRTVHEQVVNKVSAQFVDIGEQAVKNIAAPVHAYALKLGSLDQKAVPPSTKHAKNAARIGPVAVAGAGFLVLVVAALYFVMPRVGQWADTAATVSDPDPESVAEATPPPSAPPRPEMLVPEMVPFVPDRERIAIRNNYLTAPDHKALAISYVVGRFITGQSDDETAKTAAIAACQRVTDTIAPRQKCEIYAVGNTVIYARGRPPMPPQPWLVRDPAIETPFAVKDLPLIKRRARTNLENFYQGAANPKALALSPQGIVGFHARSPNLDEAVRRSLEVCGSNSAVACTIVAVDDVFVVPVPATMRVIGLFRPGGDGAIAADARNDLVHRIGSTAHGWSAIAVGSNGQPGLMLDATNEQAAVDGALEACGKRDSTCRVIAIGPFSVAPGAPVR